MYQSYFGIRLEKHNLFLLSHPHLFLFLCYKAVKPKGTKGYYCLGKRQKEWGLPVLKEDLLDLKFPVIVRIEKCRERESQDITIKDLWSTL